VALGAAALVIGYAARTAAAQPLPAAAEAEMLDYLVQSACVDGDGKLVDRLPIDPDCKTTRYLREDDALPWRKHDWGGAGGPVTGWQASDAVLAERGGVSFADQTFDFGAPAADGAGREDAFYRFDTNDGGDAIMIVGDTASAFLTQDGGTPGLQWFIGPRCAEPGRGRYVSWFLFKTDAGPEWRSVVAELNDVPKDTCPKRFNRAFTRYRRVMAEFPFQHIVGTGAPTRRSAALPTIIVEHFDAASIVDAHALERFYYARGLGKLRWEAWVTDPAKASQAESFARSGRCIELADSGPPASGWRMVDCRMWTNIVVDRSHAGWRVRDFNWPPADLTLQ
jgi:hypothetical protein